MALETTTIPPLPFMANAILNFPFDYLNPSLTWIPLGKLTALLSSNGHCRVSLKGGVKGVRKYSMYDRWWLEYDCLWCKGYYCPTSALCPQVAAFCLSSNPIYDLLHCDFYGKRRKHHSSSGLHTTNQFCTMWRVKAQSLSSPHPCPLSDWCLFAAFNLGVN